MSTHHASNFLPEHQGFQEDEIVVELPAAPRMVMQERIPLGYAPMEEIYLRGRAYRGLSSGTAPSWVLVVGWVMFGGPALVGVVTALVTALVTGTFVAFLPVLLFSSVFLMILCRGTRRKLMRLRRRGG